MRTRAERARALLIVSGLPRFLWEEAMHHTTWLQNRTPAHALNGKTLYEVRHNKKPFLGGIQEFGVAAYVKDLKAGKLDSRAQLGRFVGYDSESKGYRIFWPLKRTVTVEQNVVFNENDVLSKYPDESLTIGIQSEGERNKVIQHPDSSSNNIIEAEDQANAQNEPNNDSSVDQNEPKTPNTVPFPQTPEPAEEAENEEEPNQYGCGHCARKQPGEY